MKTRSQSGSVLVSILTVMIFLTTIIFGVMSLASANLSRARGRVQLLQAQYAAESGADAAIAVLNGGNDTYTGTATDVTLLNTAQYKASYSVAVTNGSTSKERFITATGKVYSPAAAATPRFTRTIRVTAQRSTTTTASSMVSRNIIDIASGVKDIKAKDVYVNGYINMNKNTTTLIAENITVAGKNTGASNCSIGGTGNLEKPSSFSTPAQTKTKLSLSYNNCIAPPGNTSNTNFDVSANQGSISTIQSMYIPWSQFMDGTYSSANNCNDWTTGASPRTIPSISKRTHYPDSSSNVATTCGTSGSLALGSTQYNITDNVHLRANLCSASACSPTFYNPTASLKYIFVEGTVNFDEVDTASGSGPIALIAYGTDPSSKASVCPYGGAIYLGNGGTTAAPALFLLAMNGLCLDKTKFGSAPALGGIAGKNLYIASNSGTPFDLALDTAFPVSEIPIDLAWRAARYERL
ncbi:MAG TPA: hypothetical protein VLF43_04095 [Candidatus Saccharimonadales bacterium]|nr:hypothetical protein [Candidatus Saccharimonadales bacterium]